MRDVGRPPGIERLATMVERPPVVVPPDVAVPSELARARAQIAALERKIGQQALELDFFGQALQLMNEAGRRPSGLADALASTTSSGPSAASWPRPPRGSDHPPAGG